jgi:hypothetical protein
MLVVKKPLLGKIMQDYSKLSPAEFEALVQGLQVRMRFGPNLVIATDRQGQAFQVTVPTSHKVKRFRFSPKCVDLCGYELHRPHLCCVMNLFGCGCRLPRVKAGKLPAVIPVSVYFLAMQDNRRFLRVKRFLLKKVLSIAEILAN